MDLPEYKGHSAVIEFDVEDKLFVGHVGGIADLIGFHADTETAFHEAVDDYLEILAKAAG